MRKFTEVSCLPSQCTAPTYDVQQPKRDSCSAREASWVVGWLLALLNASVTAINECGDFEHFLSDVRLFCVFVSLDNDNHFVFCPPV